MLRVLLLYFACQIAHTSVMNKEMNMNKFRAWFEDTIVTFSISESQMGFIDTNLITAIAQLHLKHEGADPLLSEVEWEIV